MIHSFSILHSIFGMTNCQFTNQSLEVCLLCCVHTVEMRNVYRYTPQQANGPSLIFFCYQKSTLSQIFQRHWKDYTILR